MEDERAKMVDLHIHTTASDGSLRPKDLVMTAKEQNLQAIAITDHDTINGVAEGMAAGNENHVEVIPGVEISTEFQKEMHILGYLVNIGSAALQKALAELRQFRNERNPKIIDRLCQLGIPITMQEVEDVAGGKVVGRPHIAQVMVKKGYAENTQDAFNRFLASGKPAYFPKERLSPAEGIQLILQAGGIPVLAHPKYLGLSEWDLGTLIEHLKGKGLVGIEAYYSTHTYGEQQLYIKLARKYQLLVTGGSDFHGASKPEIALGRGMGNLSVDYECVKALKKAKEAMR